MGHPLQDDLDIDHDDVAELLGPLRKATGGVIQNSQDTPSSSTLESRLGARRTTKMVSKMIF